jgi:hypothetical protein
MTAIGRLLHFDNTFFLVLALVALLVRVLPTTNMNIQLGGVAKGITGKGFAHGLQYLKQYFSDLQNT